MPTAYPFQVKKLTATEIVKETIDYFTQHPERRAKPADLSTCVNHTADGRMCAAARFMVDPDQQPESFVDAPNMDRLIPEVQHLPAELFTALQAFHDCDAVWEGPKAGPTYGLAVEMLELLAKVIDSR
jgi:hypothetical protein